MRISIAFVGLLLCGVVQATPAAKYEIKPEELTKAIKLNVEKYTLPNGLTVLLLEDHSAPYVSYNQWFRVGSRDEKPGLTGLAHFFEHLMFKGSEKYPFEVDKLVQPNGGDLNAFTSHDLTGYYLNLPSSKLELAISIEADRMRNLRFIQAGIDSEREVVKEERRMRYDNSISGSLNLKVWETVFKVHPYSWPVIGSMEDLNRASIKDMQDFYRIHYAPNNAFIVLVGDFKSAKAKELINKYYGSMAAQQIPPNKIFAEPEQKGERRVKEIKDVENVTFAMAYKIVGSGHEDQYALDILANILADGTSSRLHRLLVYDRQLASSVGVSSYTPADEGVFVIQASLRPGVKVDRVIPLIEAELKKMGEGGPTEVELVSKKNGIMKDHVTSLKTITGKARALAYSELYFKDYSQMFRDLTRYASIDNEHVSRVTKKYLVPSRRSIVSIEPKGAKR